MRSPKKLKGSMLVEAAIIYPMFFMILVAIIFIAIGMYQQSSARYAADTAAREASRYLVNQQVALGNGYKVVNGNLVSPSKPSLYASMFAVPFGDKTTYSRKTAETFTTSAKDAKLKDIEAYALQLYQERSVFPPSEFYVTIETKNFVLYRHIQVNITATYRTGIGFIDAMLGDYQHGYIVSAKSTATIKEEAELIRNIDFVGDYAMRVPALRRLSNGYQNLLNSFVAKITKQ